ncbi:DUF2306 domain-containing protein [Sphingomonas sp. RS2018]
MATLVGNRGRVALAPDRYEQILAVGSLALLACVFVALAKGHADWPRVPVVVWPHFATIIVALALTPVMLLRPRGDRMHRVLGLVWVAAMLLTAALSFMIREADGGFSVIHILSVWVLIQVPILWWRARQHNVAGHRRNVRGLVTGALLIAGFFTFPFNRLLGHWLFG